MFTGLLQNEITVRDVIGSPQRTLVRSLAVLWFWKNRQWSVQNRHFKQRYSIMGLHNVFSEALLLFEKSRFFQKRYALSELFKKRYSVMVYFFQESVMALWVFFKKRYCVKDPLHPPSPLIKKSLTFTYMKNQVNPGPSGQKYDFLN